MSRSYLRNKWMRRRFRKYEVYNNPSSHNSHRTDEMPKNGIGSYVSKHCHKNVWWIQEPGSFGGHRMPKGGHRIVSGLVRARVKQEIRTTIIEQITEK